MKMKDDLISRREAVNNYQRVCEVVGCRDCPFNFADGSPEEWFCKLERWLKSLPSVQSEPLTDTEQRIFLAAMGREKKVGKGEPYEDSLVRVCRAIERKVKKALWKN